MSRSVEAERERRRGYRSKYQARGDHWREVVSFDRGGGFAPGKYELSSVPPRNQMGARPKRVEENVKRDGKPKRFKHLTTNVRSVLGGVKPEGE